jgi:GxxExxY protein
VYICGINKEYIMTKFKQTNILYRDLSYQIIGVCFTVHTKIGCALPEHIYNRALYLEFERIGMPAVEQSKFDVNYNDERVGHFFTDLIIDNKIILELKSTEGIFPHHQSQLLTYLSVTKLKVGYIINFGLKQLQFKRLIL